ncbi:hypothetical protein FQZ97_984710 [compost metagenome]
MDLLLRSDQAVGQLPQARRFTRRHLDDLDGRRRGWGLLALQQLARGAEHLGRVFDHVAPGNDFERNQPGNGHGESFRRGYGVEGLGRWSLPGRPGSPEVAPHQALRRSGGVT